MEDRVWEEFFPHETETIINLPLSFNGTKDRLIWAETKKGYYTTKSAYWLLSKEAGALASNTSNLAAHKQFWVELWSMNVPNKIHHFIWWAAIDSLLTKKNLQKQKITQDSTCDRCVMELKTVSMQFGGDKWLKKFGGSWKIANISWQKNLQISVIYSKEFLLKKKNPNLAELFAYIGWSIWYNLNAKRVGTSSLPMEKIYNDAAERLQEFQLVQEGSMK